MVAALAVGVTVFVLLPKVEIAVSGGTEAAGSRPLSGVEVGAEAA